MYFGNFFMCFVVTFGTLLLLFSLRGDRQKKSAMSNVDRQNNSILINLIPKADPDIAKAIKTTQTFKILKKHNRFWKHFWDILASKMVLKRVQHMFNNK